MLDLTALVEAADAGTDNTSTLVVAGIISTVVSALAAWLTARSSARSNQAVAETTTRGDIEREAYTRAEGVLGRTIDRLEEQLEEALNRITELEAGREADQQATEQLRQNVAHYRRIGRRLARAVYEMRNELAARDIPTPGDPSLDDAVLELLGSQPPT